LRKESYPSPRRSHRKTLGRSAINDTDKLWTVPASLLFHWPHFPCDPPDPKSPFSFVIGVWSQFSVPETGVLSERELQISWSVWRARSSHVEWPREKMPRDDCNHHTTNFNKHRLPLESCRAGVLSVAFSHLPFEMFSRCIWGSSSMTTGNEFGGPFCTSWLMELA